MASEVDGDDWFRIANAQMRYYYKQDPDAWPDDEWAMRYSELVYIRKKEAGK